MSCNFLLSSLILHSKEKGRMAWLNPIGMDSFSFQYADLFKISIQFLAVLVDVMAITPALWNDTGYLSPEVLERRKETLRFPWRHKKVIILACIRCPAVSRSYSLYLMLCSLAEEVCFHALLHCFPVWSTLQRSGVFFCNLEKLVEFLEKDLW